MYHHPVIALALAKQRAAMFEQQAATARSGRTASQRRRLRITMPHRRRRHVATPRPVG